MEHYIYLLSNSPSNFTQNTNKLLHFHTELSKPLELEGEWTVCLKELIYPRLHGKNSVFFFAYSNICGFSLVGSKQYQILRPLLLKNNEDKRWVCNYNRFENDIYVPVCEKIIRNIELLIESDQDVEAAGLNFSPGDIIAILHLKKTNRSN